MALDEQTSPVGVVTDRVAPEQQPIYNCTASSNYAPTPLQPDFWDPGILSSTNWLDLQLDLYTDDLPFAHSAEQTWTPILPQQQQLTQNLEDSSQTLNASPVAVASSASAQSSKTAAEACASTDDSTDQRQGAFYVDGEAARLPRIKRRKMSVRSTSQPQIPQAGTAFSLDCPVRVDADFTQGIALPVVKYDRMLEAYQSLCLTHSGPWALFGDAHFPPKVVIEHLLGLYFAFFQLTLPFIHPPTFATEDVDAILTLAIAALGAHYLRLDDQLLVYGSSNFVGSLHELLRRWIFYQAEQSDIPTVDRLVMVQCRILNYIGLIYSGDARLRRHLERAHFEMVSCLRALRSLLQANDSSQHYGELEPWHAWARSESIRRTFYALFLLDSMCDYHFQERPLTRSSDCEVNLPCDDRIWRARTLTDWTSLAARQDSAPSLPTALQELYIEKRVPRDRSEFARIIMLHGLFRRTAEVQNFFGDPLSQWEPTAKKQLCADVVPTKPIWPPSTPIGMKWLNSVCDALDVLHWQANATIGQNSGIEHSTVAFLHLSRIVLLTPIDSIVRLAQSRTGRVRTSDAELAKDKDFVQRWATQGQYKARLAAIHAGVTFWHIHRYSVDGFYEAPAIALATLVLWAFGTFSSKQRAGKHRSHESVQAAGNSQDADDDPVCGIILLDRPTDDELVQQFIRQGHTMCANFTGVGDLYGSRGPERVLIEGIKLLESLSCWGVHREWLDLLQALFEACKK